MNNEHRPPRWLCRGGIDAEQGLIDLERSSDRLHVAAGSKEEKRVRLHLDLLTQLFCNVVLDRFLVYPADQCLSRLQAGRLKRRPLGICSLVIN